MKTGWNTPSIQRSDSETDLRALAAGPSRCHRQTADSSVRDNAAVTRRDIDLGRRVLIPPRLPRALPIGGGHASRAIWDFNGATMGTYWRARVVEGDALQPSEAEAIIREALATVVACMSPWEPDSDLGRYRMAPPGTWVPLRPHTLTVLQRALEIAVMTRGAYDPTIGRLTDALGFGPSDPATAALPGSREEATARAAVGYARLRIERLNASVLQPGGYQLDLCSIAKGYAVDLAIERLEAAGVPSCFVEIGGDARGRGCKPNGQPWWCQIELPSQPGGELPVTVAAACDLALATSGNALRKRILAEGELGHILHPLPGQTLPPGLESVTVLAPTCMEADAFATALFVLGPENGGPLAEELGLAALFIERLPGGACRERWTARYGDYLD